MAAACFWDVEPFINSPKKKKFCFNENLYPYKKLRKRNGWQESALRVCT